MALELEWNHRKAESNLAKLDVSFDEAATAFGDPLGRIVSSRGIRPMKSDLSCWAFAKVADYEEGW